MALTVNGSPIRYNLVPVEYMADGLRRYFEHGISPGSFMHAVLCGDLFGACHAADNVNRRRLFEWAYWLYNYAPSGSYGSETAVKNWIERRRKEAHVRDT